MTVRSIGSSGADYARMSLAEAGLSVFGTMTDPWVFVVFNEIIQENAITVWSNGYAGQSATNTVTIMPDFVGSGATGSSNTDCSFAGNNDYSSVALDFNGTAGKGAGFQLDNAGQSIGIQGWMIIKDLQFKTITIGLLSLEGTHDVVFARNIVRSQNPYGQKVLQQGLFATPNSTTVANNLIFDTNSGGASAFQGVAMINGNCHIVANTFCICRKVGADTTDVGSVIQTNISTPNVHGNAIYHHDPGDGTTYIKRYGATATSTYNIQNNNVTGLGGTGASTSGNIANDFETADISGGSASTAVDFRPKAGGLPLAFIPSASRFTSFASFGTGYNDTDIRGQTRVGVDNDCGCFQTAAAAAATSLIWNPSQPIMRGR